MRDILVDYRPRIVDARLAEVNAARARAMKPPFNESGYNERHPDGLPCEKNCREEGVKMVRYDPRYSDSTKSTCHVTFCLWAQETRCMKDANGSDELYKPNEECVQV